MKKKRSKILSSILIITVVLSVFFVIYIVPCSAAVIENGGSNTLNSQFYTNGNNYVGLPLDLTVSGINWVDPHIITTVSNFGGLSYNDTMTTGYGNKFSNIYWTNSNGLGYSDLYKYISPRLIQATSTDTSAWWNGKVDYTIKCLVNSSVWSNALSMWLNDELTYTSLREYLEDNLSPYPSLYNDTLPTFPTYSLSYYGLIDVDLFRSVDSVDPLAYGVFPRYLQLTHFVNDDLTTISVEQTPDSNYRYIIEPSDFLIDYAKYSFTLTYTGVYMGSDLKLHEVKDSWTHIIKLDRHSSNMSGTLGFASKVDYVTDESLIGVPEFVLDQVLNSEFDSEYGHHIDYNVSYNNVVFDLIDVMSYAMQRDASQYAYIKDIEFNIIPDVYDDICWNSNGFGGDDSAAIPLTSIRLSYDNAMKDAVNNASRGYNDYVGGVVNEQVFIDSANFNLLDWLGNTLGSIMNTDIIGNVSVGDILSVALGCGFIMLVLKFFSGG